MATKKVTPRQQQIALDLVAAWLGPKMGTKYHQPVPTGREAASRAEGPELIPDWQGHWSGASKNPTILLEGGPYDWPVEVSSDPVFMAALRSHGMWSEPATSYALNLYRL